MLMSRMKTKTLLKSTGVRVVREDAIEAFQEIAEELLTRIANESYKYLRFDEKKALTSKHVEMAVNELMPKLQ